MAKAHDDWTVLEHGPIEKLAENLWRVDGALPGMSLRRNMVVARLGDGRLVIHNGIAVREGELRELEAWGEPAFLLVPNAFHRLDAPAWKKRHPNLTVLAPRGSRAGVDEVIATDGAYEDFPVDATVRLRTLRGVREREGAMMVKSADGTSVVLNDAVFNMDTKRDPLGWLFTTAMGSAPGPRVSRLVKLLLVDDRVALRADLEEFAGISDLARLMVAHEKVALGREAVDALRKASTFL